jgi:uncharacterized protein HemY
MDEMFAGLLVVLGVFIGTTLGEKQDEEGIRNHIVFRHRFTFILIFIIITVLTAFIDMQIFTFTLALVCGVGSYMGRWWYKEKLGV